MSKTMTSRVAALTAGAALMMGAGVPVAEAAPATTTAVTVSTATTQATAVRRDTVWERAVMREVNIARKKRGMKPVKTSPCLTRALQPAAARTAKLRRPSWSKADTTRAQRCIGAGRRVDMYYVVGGPARSAKSFVNRASKYQGFLAKGYTNGGAAVYRDSAGRRWVATIVVGPHR